MRAMLLQRQGQPLVLSQVPEPEPGPGQVRIAVSACGVCRTDLHVVDGDLREPALPLAPGHQVVGRVERIGPGVAGLVEGERVGVPWLGWTCGRCDRCSAGQENLCAGARFTGYQLQGGFAEAMVADARYCFPLPDGCPDAQAAPLLCAGLIGWRALRMAGDGPRVGLWGFGSAAHILAQILAWQERSVFAFTRGGDTESQAFARRLGATWAGDAAGPSPEELDAAILFAPVGAHVPAALRAVRPGGTVVCAGIHMSDIPSFPYSNLWGERSVRSVANLCRRDGDEFLPLAARIPVRTEVRTFPLEAANEALAALREGRVQGAAVLRVR